MPVLSRMICKADFDPLKAVDFHLSARLDTKKMFANRKRKMVEKLVQTVKDNPGTYLVMVAAGVYNHGLLRKRFNQSSSFKN